MKKLPYAVRQREPFPLYGGRAGLGVFAPVVTIKTLMGAGAQSRFSPQPRGYTPTPPSPIEGEGFNVPLP
jgi:hypothetical protein